MSRSAFDAHTDLLFKNLKILNLESIQDVSYRLTLQMLFELSTPICADIL